MRALGIRLLAPAILVTVGLPFATLGVWSLAERWFVPAELIQPGTEYSVELYEVGPGFENLPVPLARRHAFIPAVFRGLGT